jgi:PAS domain-containing protein
MNKSISTLILTTLIGTTFTASTIAATNPRADYRVVNTKEFINNQQLKISTPNQIAVQLFGYTGEEEGRKAESVSINYINRDRAVIINTQEGLADDSVAAMRYRVEMQQVKGKWQIIWVGSQSKCQQGRGHQTWQGKLCS